MALWWRPMIRRIPTLIALGFAALLAGGARPASPQLGLVHQRWRVQVRLAGRLWLGVNVPAVIRLATSSAGLRLLDGSLWITDLGPVEIGREGRALLLRCAPCVLQMPQLSPEPVRLPSLHLVLVRSGTYVGGTAHAAGIRLHFGGELQTDGLDLEWRLPCTPASDLMAALGSVVPEARRIGRGGTIEATGTLRLPEGRWTVAPRLSRFDETCPAETVTGDHHHSSSPKGGGHADISETGVEGVDAVGAGAGRDHALGVRG
jgi:hypothetical protein